jgi:hypothetical protein
MLANDQTLEALAQRVAKLEAQNRRLKKIGIALLLLVSAGVLMGQAKTNKVIQANAFQIVDANGKTLGRLGVGKAGKPSLTFFDSKDLPVASLDGGEEPSLYLTRWENGAHILLRISKDFYGIDLADKRPRASLSVSHNSTGLDFWDENGEPQASMSVEKAVGIINFRDAGGKVTSEWVDTRGGTPSMALFDKDKKVVWSAP